MTPITWTAHSRRRCPRHDEPADVLTGRAYVVYECGCREWFNPNGSQLRFEPQTPREEKASY